MNFIARDKPKISISAEEMERRRKALRRADAHLRIEGLFSSEKADEIFQSFVRGEIDFRDIRLKIEALRHDL